MPSTIVLFTSILVVPFVGCVGGGCLPGILAFVVVVIELWILSSEAGGAVAMEPWILSSNAGGADATGTTTASVISGTSTSSSST